MSADFWTTIEMKGTEEELVSMLKVLRVYAVDLEKRYRTGRDCPYLNGADIRGIGSIECISEKELLSAVRACGGQLSIEASGPYGVFDSLEEIPLFEELAIAAPTASFSGKMAGWNAGGEQAVKAVLEDGKLHIWVKYPSDDYDSDDDDDETEWDDEYIFDPTEEECTGFEDD